MMMAYIRKRGAPSPSEGIIIYPEISAVAIA